MAVIKDQIVEYGLNKPNVIGEFSQEGNGGRVIAELFEWAYNNGYR